MDGTYGYTIWTQDHFRNVNQSTGHSFVVQDTQAPVISNLSALPDPQIAGNSVNITANITDLDSLANVWVNITHPRGTHENESMISAGSSKYYFATDYTFSHLDLNSEFKGRIKMGYYESGHMMWIRKPSLAKFKMDIAEFIQSAIQD